jgi:rod shape determining protein RodA
MTDKNFLLKKLVHFDWLLIISLVLLSCTGFLMLYSVAGGSVSPWAKNQMIRFCVGLIGMFIVGFISIKFWRTMSVPMYVLAFILLILVEIMGHVGMGAQRWINVGGIQVQPSEFMKIGLVMILARYYSWLNPERVSHPIWVLIPLILIALPVVLVLKQPNLGTSLMLVAGGMGVMFLAGVSLWYFFTFGLMGGSLVTAVMLSQGTSWQLLKDYQYRRINTFLNPETDPLGAGYHIMQSKIAFGSGGVDGRGFLQGTQSYLHFLPETHTDFIFTALGEEFGLIGTLSLLGLYVIIILLCFLALIRVKSRYERLVITGIAITFFLYMIINTAMVTGIIPVVGIPLPMISYGGTSMLVLLFGFGLIQSALAGRDSSNTKLQI